MAMSDEEIQGRMYLHWLETYTSGAWQNDRRVRMEHARLHIDPLYEMDLGTFIHPLEQSYPAQYKVMIDNLRVSSNRISRECLQVDSYGTWCTLLTYIIGGISIRRSMQEKVHHTIKSQEALADKLIGQQYRTRITFRDWSQFMDAEYLNSTPSELWSRSLGEDRYIPVLTDVVEETTQEELLTIDSEIDPADSKGDTEVVSNVINFLLEKSKREEDVQSLLSETMFNFAGYTAEEKEGVHKFVLQLTAMLPK